MDAIFLIYLPVILYSTGSVTSNDVFVLKDTLVCKNDICIVQSPHNEYEASTSKPAIKNHLSHDFVFKNSSRNLVKIKYLNTGLEKTASQKSVHNKNVIEGSRGYQRLQTPSDNLEKTLMEDMENETEAYSTTDVTEIVTETSTFANNIPETTTDLSVEKKTFTAAPPKLDASTTQMPSFGSEVFLFQNSKKASGICFCDLSLNHCDINCCCDSDCTLSHFKVFTRCIDDSPEYDPNYCFKTNFIFSNNTLHKIIQNEGGLFCIVRDNLERSKNYQTRPLITTLEAFNKSLLKNIYTFSYKSLTKSEFTSMNYQAGSFLWTLQDGEIKPLGIPAPSMGLLCFSQINVRYLMDIESSCTYQSDCGKQNGRNLLRHLKHMNIISNPGFINQSVLNSSKICEGKACLPVITYLCQTPEDVSACVKIDEKTNNLQDLSCWNTATTVQYHIWHNGSGGIIKFEAYVWIRYSVPEEQFMQVTKVRFFWWGSSQKVFKRSGNPGYLTGKPILAGKKVYYIVNETSEKREAIEMSADSRDWLTVVGSERGICSSKLRNPIKFRENSQYTCSLKLTRDNFGKDKCLELQSNIFKTLIGDEIVNATKENYFNKFVATFGNSKIEETGDWVQVLIDLFPIISSQTGFRSSHYQLMCKNIITDLHIDVAYSNIGSFLTPQSKILGVSYFLGKHKDLIFDCDTPDCESQSIVQGFKLSSFVRFIDLTQPAVDAFAEPLTLEARLPHDFFYPFFSKSSTMCMSTFALMFSLLALL